VAGAEPASEPGGEFEAGDAAPDDDDGLHGVLPVFRFKAALADTGGLLALRSIAHPPAQRPRMPGKAA
jgi:hypothetical protein